jgi:LysM repeat protein
MERAVIVPPDITTLSALSKRTGVGLPAIRAANPQLAWNAMAIPVNRRLAVPKWTTHVVVTAKEQDEEDRSETLLQIAAQHKAMTEEVKSANQHVDWTKPLPEGTPLLVPDR